LLSLMPLPNISGVAPRQNNYVSSPVLQTNYEQYMVRADYTISDHWSLFYRHFLQDNDIFNPFQDPTRPTTRGSRPRP
jgi:hypothetical protein